MVMNGERLEKTIAKIDAILAQDPNQVVIEGQQRPMATIHAEKRTGWVEKLTDGTASDALQIAARAQHIRRWEIPRDTYPRNRTGYLKWRTDLKHFHATQTAEIMRETGYDEVTVDRVKTLITKKRLKQDKEVQTLEDALCLVFLETQFSDFAQKEADKIVNILQKTWKKMSSQGQKLALTLSMSDADRAILEEALAG